MKPPRGLSAEEAALWERVAKTVTPLRKEARLPRDGAQVASTKAQPKARQAAKAPASAVHRPVSAVPPKTADPRRHGLDSSWDRKLSRGSLQPDFTLDLHGASLDAAHGRLIHGLSQAKAMGARIVLLVTGRPRPVDPADRTSRRGAIRAKVIDWLAASEHAGDIAAIQSAHPRHGGQGALYVVLRRRR